MFNSAWYAQASATKAPSRLFYGAKVLTPILLVLLALVTGAAHFSPFFVYAVAAGRTDFSRRISGWAGRLPTRQAAIEAGSARMFSICWSSVSKPASAWIRRPRAPRRNWKRRNQQLSDELGIVALEQRAGRARSDAWKHLAERTDVDVIRNLVSMLVQAEQFGTSIGKTLRVHSDTLRTKRVQEIEEKAAKLSVKLLFPLVLFIFPSLFLVVLGPAVLVMADSFKTFFGH